MQTISPETAKRLKELGVNQSVAYFHWVKKIENSQENIFILPFQKFCYHGSIKDSWAAFTLDEILEMLPMEIDTNKKRDGDFHFSTLRGFYLERRVDHLVFLYGDHTGANLYSLVEKENTNPTEAAGQLLIWAIENGYVKIENKEGEHQ